MKNIETTLNRQNLSTLRNSYTSNSINKHQFVLQSAKLYLRLKLPKRAKALLGLIDKSSLSIAEAHDYTYIKNRTIPFSSLPYQQCSLNMIVKNEELQLSYALNSIDSIMDEIVICDTGSTDGTVALAELYGVIIIHDTWKKDFSRARNKAIEVSSCDWIFWMDADDILDTACRVHLKNIWRYATPMGALFTVSNNRQNNTSIDFIQVRLFPRKKHIRFQQSIHEQIMYSIKEANLPFVKHLKIIIYHTGYATSEMYNKKIMRNKSLIEQELSKTPGDPTLQLGLADCFYSLNEFKNAKQLYNSIITNDTAWQKNSDVFIQAHTNLANLYLVNNMVSKAKKYLYHILYLDDTRIEARFILAKLFLKDGNEKKAQKYFMQCARANPPIRMTAVDTKKIKMESIFFLVNYLIKNKRFDEALPILESSIKIYPTVPQYRTQMGQIYLNKNKLQKAATCFTNSISLSSENNDDAFRGIAEIYSILGDNVTAGDYLKKTCVA